MFNRLIQTSLMLQMFLSVSSAHAKEPSALTLPVMSAHQERVIEKITTVFENGTSNFKYNYLEDIKSGEGLTVGRVGFNTFGGSIVTLIKTYLAAKPAPSAADLLDHSQFYFYVNNGCLDSLPTTHAYRCLFPDVSEETIATDAFKVEGGGVSEIDFGKAWMNASTDPIMIKTQDDLVRNDIFEPALKISARYGIKTAIGVSVIYDTILQQGPGALDFIVPEVNRKFTHFWNRRQIKTPLTGVNEVEWLKEFLKWRLLTQAYGYSLENIRQKIPSTYDTTPRSRALLQVLESGNLDLNQAVKFNCYGEDYTITD